MVIWLGDIAGVERIVRESLCLSESDELNAGSVMRQLGANEDDVAGVLFQIFHDTGYSFQNYFSAGANRLTPQGVEVFQDLSEHLRRSYPRNQLAVKQSQRFHNFAENGHLSDILDFTIADLAAIRHYAIDSAETVQTA